MQEVRRSRDKIVEWGRRYLPLEIAGWVGELGTAALAYLWTDSLAVAAIAASIGSSVGYYLPAYVLAARWATPADRDRPWLARIGVGHLLAVRSLAMEFGLAEVIDSLLVRPALIYAGPVLIDHVVLGWVLGGFVADVVFYVCTILSYERFKGLLARRQPEPSIAEEDSHEPAAAVSVA